MNPLRHQIIARAQRSARQAKTESAIFSAMAEAAESASDKYAAIASRLAALPDEHHTLPLVHEFVAANKEHTDQILNLHKIFLATNETPPDLVSPL